MSTRSSYDVKGFPFLALVCVKRKPLLFALRSIVASRSEVTAGFASGNRSDMVTIVVVGCWTETKNIALIAHNRQMLMSSVII